MDKKQRGSRPAQGHTAVNQDWKPHGTLNPCTSWPWGPSRLGCSSLRDLFGPCFAHLSRDPAVGKQWVWQWLQGQRGRKALGYLRPSPQGPVTFQQPAPLFSHSDCTVGVHSVLSVGLPCRMEGMLLPDHWLPQAPVCRGLSCGPWTRCHALPLSLVERPGTQSPGSPPFPPVCVWGE